MRNIIRKLIPLSVRKKIYEIRNASDFKKEIVQLKSELFYYKVLAYFNDNPSPEYKNETAYLKETGKLITFPYRQLQTILNIEGGYDKVKKMPYVLHNNKRLFFPDNWSLNGAKHVYANYIETENILGGGYSEKAPHQYLTEEFNIDERDVVIDVGAAEGLFLLDVIERIKKAYILEPDKGWLKTLRATFEPYKDKVTIIEKYATDIDSANETKLDSCIDVTSQSLFIKMDVEGFEQKVLNGATNLLAHKNVKVACCTYHKQNDAFELDNFFKSKGFETAFSEGYILFPYDENIQPPYFRKGMIRARKK